MIKYYVLIDEITVTLFGKSKNLNRVIKYFDAKLTSPGHIHDAQVRKKIQDMSKSLLFSFFKYTDGSMPRI